MMNYEPLPDAIPFHNSDSFFRFLTGDRCAGKSYAAAWETAMHLQDDGSHAGIVGHDSLHLGIMWLLLSQFLDDALGVQWHNKSNQVPERVRLPRDRRIDFFLNSSLPRFTGEMDVVWIDGDIKPPLVCLEWLGRLIDREGTLLWSGPPHVVVDLPGDPDVFTMSVDNNNRLTPMKQARVRHLISAYDEQ